MAHPTLGEQFPSSPILNRVPPHLRKKVVDASSPSASPTPAAVIAHDSSDESSTAKMTPSTNSTYTLLMSSSPAPPAFDGEMAGYAAARVPPPNPIREELRQIRRDQSMEFLPPPSEEITDGFKGASHTLSSSIHAQPGPEKQDLAPSSPNASRSAACGPTGTLATNTSHSGEIRRYQVEDLIDIAKQCSGRLPPASAVQAMFLYEMQRETESERLFEGQMFRLAQQEDELVTQARRNAEMEARLAKLERQVANNDVQARIATRDVRMNVQQQKLAEQAARLEKAEDAFKTMSEQHQALKQTHQKFAADTEAALKDVVRQASSAAKIVVASSANKSEVDPSDVKIMKDELDVLFNDRDGILSKLAEVFERMQTLADNIHQLTIRKTAAQASSPAPIQRIPAFGPNGDLVDVTIPKGKPAVGLNGSQHAPVKSFVPGTRWAT
ncbi:hypothetical protein Slin14017_G118190 [Septoria linicola]|nr:hypothetical protein Slin14017_G118190 [Septoria linicola]